MSDLLLCGGTGDLGGRIAARLAERRIPFRALVRPASDRAALRALGAELTVGDLTDPAGLDRALAGVRTVVTTANAIGRRLAGAEDVSIDRVDRDGNAALIRAAEAAGVDRFVFVSALGMTDAMVALVPFFAARRATERLLQDSSLRSVIVRPAAFQETWLGPEAGIRPDERRAVVYGRGRTPVSYVAEDDVGEVCVRLATMDDPPGSLDFGGPEALTRCGPSASRADPRPPTSPPWYARPPGRDSGVRRTGRSRTPAGRGHRARLRCPAPRRRPSRARTGARLGRCSRADSC